MPSYIKQNITQRDARFVGRERELAELQLAFERAQKGRPIVMTLLAETGLGKTRLAQELFNWLSTTIDKRQPVGYWPDRLKSYPTLHVNPEWRQLLLAAGRPRYYYL